MKTECSKQKLLFEGHGRRAVVAAFDGGKITSDAGGLLLREVEERFRILRPFVDSFTDHRSPDAIEFTVEDRDRGVPLAGKNTLNRLELTPAGAGKHSRYKKTVASVTKLQNTLVDTFIRMRSKQGVPTELVLDLDATDDPLHGNQLGKFFHGYYKNYCYLP